jgi:hypothetical protein
MDKGSLNRRAHQLRYGLPTDAFLDRDPDQRVNDIWTFLYDEAQRWYFRPELPLGRAYVFETLGTPHGSCVVPGEALAAARYRQLAAAGEALARGDAAELRRCLAAPQEPATGAATLPLRRAIEAMDALLHEVRGDAARLCASDAPDAADAWRARAARAMDAVVRKSLEMRVVALRIPTLRTRRRALPALNAPAARPPPADRPR